MGEICRGFGISEASYCRLRAEYGGLKLDQARRLKELEKENARLSTAVAELTLVPAFGCGRAGRACLGL